MIVCDEVAGDSDEVYFLFITFFFYVKYNRIKCLCRMIIK